MVDCLPHEGHLQIKGQWRGGSEWEGSPVA